MRKKLSKTRLGLVVLLVLSLTLSFSLPVSAASKVSLNQTKATISCGRYVKLKVQNTKKSVSWSSSNPSIARVNKNGKVTGVAKGSATITAKVGSKKLTCAVKVKVNQWNTSKNLKKLNAWTDDLSISKSRDVKAQPTSAYYDANSNLVIKLAVLNHSAANQGNYVLQNLSMTVKSAKGKVIAQGNFKFNNLNIAHFKFSYVTITFNNGGTKAIGDLRKNFEKKITYTISAN